MINGEMIQWLADSADKLNRTCQYILEILKQIKRERFFRKIRYRLSLIRRIEVQIRQGTRYLTREAPTLLCCLAALRGHSTPKLH